MKREFGGCEVIVEGEQIRADFVEQHVDLLIGRLVRNQAGPYSEPDPSTTDG